MFPLLHSFLLGMGASGTLPQLLSGTLDSSTRLNAAFDCAPRLIAAAADATPRLGAAADVSVL